MWKIWNGAGGPDAATGHAWSRYVDKTLFATHPEYFALRSGARKQSDWYCTSNPDLRKIFADGVIRVLDSGDANASISPPDGIGYCECDACRAQDDPASIEPSSGHVSVTDRYVDFFNDVARRVRAKHPTATLNFYCYADYTQAPTRGLKLEPNLVAWIAPLRYCRLHAIGNPNCPSRTQLAEMIDGWSAAGKIAYRTYNYNLAECLVPFPMLSVWQHDIPYLLDHGATGINLETLASWQIYGPHIYQSIRLAYDPRQDATRLMDDYYTHFYGPAAAEMKDYWTTLDRAYAHSHAHAGSFFAIHNVYTPDVLSRCRSLIEEAKKQSRNSNAYSARVAMHAEGFRNAEQYIALRHALNTGQTPDVSQIYETLLSRAQQQVQSGYGNRYTPDYLQRFLGKQVTAAGTARVLTVLPDQWRLEYDPDNTGQSRGFPSPDFNDSTWTLLRTYTDTLDAQGLPDRKTILWYRTTFTAPAPLKNPALLFLEIDGTATAFLNGTEIGHSDKKRTPFTLPAPALRPGQNTIAVRVDHTAISELFLGGIIRPIYLIDQAQK